MFYLCACWNKKIEFYTKISAVCTVLLSGGNLFADDGAHYSEEIELNNYKFPTEAARLSELAIVGDAGYERSLSELRAILVNSNTTQQIKKVLEPRCREKFARDFPLDKKLITTSEDLACIPYYIYAQNQVTQIVEPEKRQPYSESISPSREDSWKKVMDKDFSTAFRMLKPKEMSEIQKYVKYFRVTSGDCRYRNAGSAIIAHAETWLPDEAMFSMIEEVYQKVSPCLKPYEDGYERTHMRAGLLRLAKNNSLGAAAALGKALLTEDPKEKFRTLFWLGAIDMSLGDKTKTPNTNVYWDLLLKNHPFELHSIIAAQYLEKDPLVNLTDKKNVKAFRKNGGVNSQYNLVVAALELFVARKDYEAVSAAVKYAQGALSAIEPGELVYFALFLNEAKAYRESISLFSRYLRETKYESVNLRLLELYFPVPYEAEILENCGIVDPVLIFALIRQESAFNPKARSIADARGLMQLLPTTARRYQKISAQELYNHLTNIKIGVRLLTDLMEKFSGRAEQVLSAYNAGPGHIVKWQIRYPVQQTLLFSDLIPFKETRFYVSNILRNAYWYGRILTTRNDAFAKLTIEKSSQSKWHSDVVNSLLSYTWNTDNKDLSLAKLFELNSNTWNPDSALLDVLGNKTVQEFPELELLDPSNSISIDEGSLIQNSAPSLNNLVKK